MERLIRIFKAVYHEIVKPKSFVLGEAFEQYLRNYIFPQDLYYLEHRSHDYNTNRKDYVEESLDPDFLFVSVNNEKEFFIEAKYRSSFSNNAVEWCKVYQLSRYKDVNRDLPVFIALGVGGTPNFPEHLYVFPVKYIKYTKLYKSLLSKYEFKVDRPIHVSTLWKML